MTGKQKTAILLNALVLPGLGQIHVGNKIKGVTIAMGTIAFVLVAIYKYISSLSSFAHLMIGKSTLLQKLLLAMSEAWGQSRKFVLLCVLAIIILWIYSIVDILLYKNIVPTGDKNGMQS